MVEFATLEEVKNFFGLEDEDELDELLQFLIEHYSEVISVKTGISQEGDILPKEALFFAIGCHLSKTHMEVMYPVLAFTIGNVKERLQAPANSDTSWCKLYDRKIDEIIVGQQTGFAVGGFKRKGLSDLNEFQ